MKIVLTLKVRGSSTLASQKYGENQKKSKPQYHSILGSCVYGKISNNKSERKHYVKKGIYKN